MDNYIITYESNVFASKIRRGKECPYCGKPTEHIDSKIVYGPTSDFGMIYICVLCDAYVGVHSNNPTISLGSVAKKELRELRKKAHFYFDSTWRHAHKKRGGSRQKTRLRAYKWLARQLALPVHLTHFGMFDKNYCRRAISAIKPIYDKINLQKSLTDDS